MAMLIRFFGLFLFCFGAWMVAFDLTTIFVYGEPDASLLAMLLYLTEWSGDGEWWAFAGWIAPMVAGAMMLLVPSARPLTRRPSRQPGT